MPATKHFRPKGRVSKAQLRKQKAKVNFDLDVPRCGTCAFYNPTWKGDGDIIPPWCKRNKFYTKPTACCDLWVTPKGVTLELEPAGSSKV